MSPRLQVSDFIQLREVLSGKANFAIVSYGSYAGQQGETDYRGFARTASDERKITSAWHYIKSQSENMGVWADCVSWDAATGGAEQYDFNPMRTLGAVYKYAKYTLAIVEQDDATWLEQAFEEYREQPQDFATAFMQESKANSFYEGVATNQYSFWNRAWILQEIFQSNAVLYCRWQHDVLTPLGTGSTLGKMAEAVMEYKTGPVYKQLFKGWGLTPDNSVLMRLETMAKYLIYAMPPIHRARQNVNYNYQEDLFTAITFRKYYAIDRSNALQAIAVLLGLYVYPLEVASARAVHHAMIRMGALPISSYKASSRSQLFANSTWASRSFAGSASTEELQNYISVPIPGEMLPDGRLGLCGSSVEGTILPPREEAGHYYRDLSVAKTVVASIPAVRFAPPAESRRQSFIEDCIVLRTEKMTFFVCPERTEVIGSVLNHDLQLQAHGLSEDDWRIRFLTIR